MIEPGTALRAAERIGDGRALDERHGGGRHAVDSRRRFAVGAGGADDGVAAALAPAPAKLVPGAPEPVTATAIEVETGALGVGLRRRRSTTG